MTKLIQNQKQMIKRKGGEGRRERERERERTARERERDGDDDNDSNLQKTEVTRQGRMTEPSSSDCPC